MDLRIPQSFIRTLLKPRRYSTKPKNKIDKKSVIVSKSKDIFTNLALEDWLYRHFDFTNHHVLMLWQNDPCVVIGRHQNPWMEANVFALPCITENGVTLARRNSGGGTVYHDNGNLNLTFFTSRDDYKRKVNLELISKAVFNDFGINLEINPREDLCLNGSKVSGTAAKLGRTAAYHHCTLLVNSNKDNLRQALAKDELIIETTATKSTKSKIVNLTDVAFDVSVENMMDAVRKEYLDHSDVEVIKKSFQVIAPDNSHFPGLEDLRKQFESWDWRYGKTPKFKVLRRFAVPPGLREPVESCDNELTVAMEVEKARIVAVGFVLNADGLLNLLAEREGIFGDLLGKEFGREQLDRVDVIVRSFVSELFKNKSLEIK